MTTRRFSLLVPVKDAAGAKTRLGQVGTAGRADLMTAFARDAIAAALGTSLAEVYVVGDTATLPILLQGLEVGTVPDEGRGDLNVALRRAADRVARPDRGVAVMLADLPCLRTDDLEEALAVGLGQQGRAFVPDAAGTGTTLLLAPPATTLDPHFGRGSAAAHVASGATPIGAELASLRLDVDTAEDLDRALRFGVGPNTARATAHLDRDLG